MDDVILLPTDGALSVKEFCRWASLGRTAVYEEIARGKIKARKIGRRTIIPLAEARRWLNSLPTVEQAWDDADGLIHYTAGGTEIP